MRAILFLPLLTFCAGAVTSGDHEPAAPGSPTDSTPRSPRGPLAADAAVRGAADDTAVPIPAGAATDAGAPRAPDGAAAAMPIAPPPVDRAALVAFMRKLVDFIYKNQVVSTVDHRTYGMTYEFWKDGRWIQEFGLDAMHDGAWFINALVTADMVDPEGQHLARLQKYQIPFYTNLLSNSDRLFPNMRPATDDERRLTAPVKGWCPRGWDDASGFTTRGERLPNGYDTNSNHLAQDLADGLLSAWLATRDPAIAQALLDQKQYKNTYFGPIRIVDFAANAANGQALGTPSKSVLSPASLGHAYVGLYEQKGTGIIPIYSDIDAWIYDEHVARHVLGQPFPDNLALHLAGKMFGAAVAMEVFCDDGVWPEGMFLFDLLGNYDHFPHFVQGGKLNTYRSSPQLLFYGGRGLQLVWLAAAALPVLARDPTVWERRHQTSYANEPRVRFVDELPKVDGNRDAAYGESATLSLNGATLSLVSGTKSLYLLVDASAPNVSFDMEPASSAVVGKRSARIAIGPAQAMATNDLGQALKTSAAFASGNGRWRAEIEIPYTVVPGQAPWLNGAENGRYTVRWEGGSAVVYMLSEPRRAVRRLERLVSGAIASWYDVWMRMGYIPSGVRSARNQGTGWEISDSGNAAHLIKTIAHWLIYTEGKTTAWELARTRAAAKPNPAPPLPDEVLRLQGLK